MRAAAHKSSGGWKQEKIRTWKRIKENEITGYLAAATWNRTTPA